MTNEKKALKIYYIISTILWAIIFAVSLITELQYPQIEALKIISLVLLIINFLFFATFFIMFNNRYKQYRMFSAEERAVSASDIRLKDYDPIFEQEERVPVNYAAMDGKERKF